MTDYLVEYEHLYCAMIEHDMPLQAFKLIDGANLSKDELQLTLTLANELKFETMKSALKRLFTVHHDNDENDALKFILVKQDEGYYSKKRYMKIKNKKETPFLNPLNNRGEISRCIICDSKMHWT